MPAARTRRRLLIVLAGVGVVAGVVGIGASIAGVDDDRDPGPAPTASTSAPPAIDREEAERIAGDRVPGPVDRAELSEEGWEVRIDTEHGHVDVLVDATTGAVLEVDD